MSKGYSPEGHLSQLINAATGVAQEDAGHKLQWDLISARDLEAHAHCTKPGCKGFVYIKIVDEDRDIYQGSAIKEECPTHIFRSSSRVK